MSSKVDQIIELSVQIKSQEANLAEMKDRLSKLIGFRSAPKKVHKHKATKKEARSRLSRIEAERVPGKILTIIKKKGGEVSTGDIFQKLKLSHGVFFRAINTLIDQKLVKRTGNGVYEAIG